MLGPLFPSRPWLWFGRLTLLLLLIVAAGAGAATGVLLALIGESPPLPEFEHYSPRLITRVYDRTGATLVAEFYSVERRDFVPIEEVPTHLIDAFRAAEDERFYDHVGVSPWDVLVSAYWNFRSAGIVRGASTITMQLARKTLEDVGTDRNIERKIREALAALQIESRYVKDQILEFYLNQIPMGNGVYGVQAAARYYFGVDVQDLSLAQCATIAGLTQIPERFNPIDARQRAEQGRRYYRDANGQPLGPDDSTWRRNLVLRNMRDLNYITEEEYLSARAEGMMVSSLPDRQNLAPYFVDLVRRQIREDPEFGRGGFSGQGWTIRSTMDLPLQRLAEQVLTGGLATAEAMWHARKEQRLVAENDPDEGLGWRLRVGQRRLVRITAVEEDLLRLRHGDAAGECAYTSPVPFFRPERILRAGELIDVVIEEIDAATGRFTARLPNWPRIEGAMVVLDNDTGEVLALVGGTDWSHSEYNRAVQDGRQPGSCFKPFAFAAAMENGMTPATVFTDQRVEFNTGGREPYVPVNYENRYFGDTTLIEALEHSRNVVTVLMTRRIGVSRTRDYVQRFDFADRTRRWQVPNFINLGLGVHDVSPLSLACGYATIANGGRAIRPRAWTELTPPNTRAGWGSDTRSRSSRIEARPDVLSPQHAYQVVHMMRQAVRTGTGQATIGNVLLGQEDMPQIAGKTGTTTNNIDAWFGGMTPDWTVIVRVGFDDNTPLGPEMTGGKVAGPIWADFIERAIPLWRETHPNEPLAMEFSIPEGLVFRDICSESGLLWSSACGSGQVYPQVPFVAGTEPTASCGGGYHGGSSYTYGSSYAAPGDPRTRVYPGTGPNPFGSGYRLPGSPPPGQTPPPPEPAPQPPPPIQPPADYPVL